MDIELKIIPTADGSNTIYNPQVGENYHSAHGALQESKHVFVNAGLRYYLEAPSNPIAIGSPPEGEAFLNPVSILEVGFGTGLNFLLSAGACAEQGIDLNYTGIEAYPLSPELISQTGYQQFVSPEVWQQFIANYGALLRSSVQLNPGCKLQIAHCKLLNFQSEKQYDIIYFDAFASARQPEMWDETSIGHTIQFLKPGGVFVTYAITGNLKRTLKALGCKIEKVKGAPGKREMLRAVKIFKMEGF